MALPGNRVDGHDLIPEAVEKGAAGVLCHEGRAVDGVSCLEVDDTRTALGLIANGHRRQCGGRIVGITGSAGKTTVKDFLFAMCDAAGDTCATPGNWNNFIGLPLSILRMEVSDSFGIFEMGMNQAGEISRLAAILEPETACITSIGEAHLEQLGSVSAIAREKISLFASIPEEGMCVIDLDSDWHELMKETCRSGVLTCSLYGDADVMGHVVPDQPEMLRIEDRRHGDFFDIPVPLPGEHMRKNVLQAAILARELGVSPEQITEGLHRYKGSPNRWQEFRIGKLKVINDAYNANPLSMRCALKAFSEQTEAASRWAVLGEMAELGPKSAAYHHELGCGIDALNLDGVILVGEGGKWIAEGIEEKRVIQVMELGEAVEAVKTRVPPDATLFLKASRSVGLEKLIDGLKERVTQ